MIKKTDAIHCQITGEVIPIRDAVPVRFIRDSLIPILKQKNPNLDPEGYISLSELNKARVQHAEDVSKDELGELMELKKEVTESLLRQETLTKNSDKEFDAKATKGEKLADKVASFGGSWTFIIIFCVVLFAWMGINTTIVLSKPFDPFPYIFLNLVLSCLAAIQAPVIMMSQNRGEARDRLRADNDYKVNLKAEIEIQSINEKIDKLISEQWKHLLEIQQIQMEMIEELTKNRGK